MRTRLAIVGTAPLATAVAGRLATRDWADIVLVDDDSVPAAADLQAAIALDGGAARVSPAAKIADAAGAEIVVLVDSSPDLAELAARCPQAIVVVAGEGVLDRTAAVLKATSFPRQRVIGVAGAPQAAQLAALLAAGRDLAANAVDVRSIGGVGDAMIVLGEAGDGRLLAEVRGAPPGPAVTAAAAAALIDGIVADARRVLVCATRCEGEYGIDGVVCVPVVTGSRGVERIVELELDAEQLDALRRAAVP